uniref:Uncharacterized protein n=1 Tax=Arundo donax TaxID=35708 RepID=A0A0A9BBU6_ARUDO
MNMHESHIILDAASCKNENHTRSYEMMY